MLMPAAPAASRSSFSVRRAGVPTPLPPPYTHPASGALDGPPGRAHCGAMTRADIGQLSTAPQLRDHDGRPPPRHVGRFTVNGELGRGGMGVVYAGFDPALHRPVAIKLLRDPAGLSLSQTRMHHEARAMAQLSHPNVAQVHEVGEHEGQVYIAMEYVAGMSLHHWLRNRQPGLWQVLEAFMQAGRGLAAAHARGLVHGDFKPSNVIVSVGAGRAGLGQVRVLDFGLARFEAPHHGADVPVGGADGGLAGTPVYMAPEQFRSEPATAQTDQFAFGVALFEALHGHRPFAGVALDDLAAQVITGDRAAAHDADLPKWLGEALDRALAVDPGARFASMDELLAAIDHGRTDRGLGLEQPHIMQALARARWRRHATSFAIYAVGWAVTLTLLANLASVTTTSAQVLVVGALLFMVVAGCITGFSFIYRGRLARFGTPGHSLALSTSIPQVQTLELLVRNAAVLGCLIDDQRWHERALLLRVRPSYASFGPLIRFQLSGDETTRVYIDLRPVSRLLDWGWREESAPVLERIRVMLGDDRPYPPGVAQIHIGSAAPVPNTHATAPTL